MLKSYMMLWQKYFNINEKLQTVSVTFSKDLTDFCLKIPASNVSHFYVKLSLQRGFLIVAVPVNYYFNRDF